MTVQESAYLILKKENKPLHSKEIAKRILEKKYVKSWAIKPIDSIVQTLEKNIRENRYNKPELVFHYKSGQRLIWLLKNKMINSEDRIITISINNSEKIMIRYLEELLEFDSDRDLNTFLFKTGIETIREKIKIMLKNEIQTKNERIE